MKIEDIRVGNIIQYNNNSFHEVITAICGNTVHYGMSCESDIKNMNPINISDEMLERLGFVKENAGRFRIYRKGVIECYPDNDNVFSVVLECEGLDGCVTQYTGIQYVHELQNFYRSFHSEGDELIYTPKDII